MSDVQPGDLVMVRPMHDGKVSDGATVLLALYVSDSVIYEGFYYSSYTVLILTSDDRHIKPGLIYDCRRTFWKLEKIT